MNLPDDLPYLLCRAPTDPDSTTSFSLRDDVTCLGRLEPHEVEPPGAGYMQLLFPSVSTRHARIIRTDQGYVLYNWQGRHGIGLYERELHLGESYLLAHCDVFRIPNREQHFQLQFLASTKQTQVAPLHVERQMHRVYVFGELVPFTSLEYQLIAYVQRHSGQVCSYDALIDALWAEEVHHARKGNLEVLLTQVRRKLRDASGGFTFLETVRGEGVRLVV